MSQSDELDRLFGDKKIPRSIMIKRLLSYIKPVWYAFLFAGLLLVLNVASDISLPYIAKIITEKLNDASGSQFYPILIFAIAMILITIIGQICLYFESLILHKAGQKIVYTLRMEVFTHIENMSLDQLNEMPVGSLVTRVASYTQAICDLFVNILINLLKNILTIVFAYIVLTTLSFNISLVMLAFVAVVFIASLIFNKIIRSLFKKERKAYSDMNSFLSENISGMKITQAYNQQKRKLNEFQDKSNIVRKIILKEVIAFGLYRPFITFLYLSALGVTILLSFKFGLLGPTMYSIYLYLTRFFTPVQNISDQLNGIQKAMTSAERLFNLLDVPPKILDDEDAIDVDKFVGCIEFKHVWFAYKEDNWILKDVSFTINPKETVAFIGATGAGKTTILALLVRNYEIQKGEILIDGINIKKIKTNSLRSKIGQMLQDVFLFSGTIKDNITLHDDSISDEEVLESCKYVNADTFIDVNKNGLYEEVCENGENFSQGQKQLLSFARTIIHKPQILVLDEATANIDTETELTIQKSLEKMKGIGTMLVVAHRLSTIQNADQIIVLSNGEIIERGDHNSLLKLKGYYYHLYELQFKEQS